MNFDLLKVKHSTTVLYFGSTSHQPLIENEKSINSIIHKVCFDPKVIGAPDSKDDLNNFKDYYDFVRQTTSQEINFTKVICGYDTVFLIDESGELWVFGHGMNG